MKIKAFQCRSFNDSYNITLSEPIVRSIISLRQSYIPSSSSESIKTTFGAKLTISPHFFPLNSAPTTPRIWSPKALPDYSRRHSHYRRIWYIYHLVFATRTIGAFLTLPSPIAIFAARSEDDEAWTFCGILLSLNRLCMSLKDFEAK